MLRLLANLRSLAFGACGFISLELFLAVALAQGQYNINTLKVQLEPAPPNYPGDVPGAVQLLNYQVTIGDLNGDVYPDIVLSNSVAFLRVYWMGVDGEGRPTVVGHDDPLPCDNAINECASDGDGARFLTVAPTLFDSPVIHDIDLDGIQELIYLEHQPDDNDKGSIRLRVYEHDSGMLVPQPHNEVELDFLADQLHDNYFSPECDCMNDCKDHNQAIYLAVGNMRGLAYPQDILVYFGHPSRAASVAVFAYESTSSSPTVVKLFDHSTFEDNPAIPDDWRGASGHSWLFYDIDYDGREELIGRHVLTLTPAGDKELLWGMDLWRESGDGDVPGDANETHPDYVGAVDFIETYLDESGKVIPCPGIEVLAAPQTAGVSGDWVPTDPSGPLVYRGIHGHDPDPAPGQRRTWPRKLVNLFREDPPGDGNTFYFPSSPSLGWNQPVDPGLPNESHWDDFGLSLQNGFTGDPSAQFVIPGNLIAAVPGVELLTLAKANMTQASCTGLFAAPVHYLFDSTNSLTVLAWGTNIGNESNPKPQGPIGMGFGLIDFGGARDQLEFHSAAHLVPNDPPPPPSCDELLPKWTLQEFVEVTGQDHAYQAQSFYSRPITASERVSAADGFRAYDLFGDNREEFVLVRLYDPMAGHFKGELEIVYDTHASGARGGPSPRDYLEYRRARAAHPTRPAPYFDLEDLVGVRFWTQSLATGVTGRPYGVLQDLNLTDPPAVHRGCVLVAEGGTSPYEIELVDGVLPTGIVLSTLTAASDIGELLLIEGTPTEACTRKLTFRVTDSTPIGSQTQERDFWLRIDPGDSFDPDKSPQIVAGGFGDLYLRAGIPQTVFLTVSVEDTQGLGDIDHVELFDGAGGLLGNMTSLGGGQYTFGLSGVYISAGRRHFSAVAVDQGQRRSLPWPYVVAEGGPGNEDPPFLVGSDPPAGQTEAQTPFIRSVTFDSLDLPAAETSDSVGSLTFTVHVNTRGYSMRAISVRVLHPLTTDLLYKEDFPVTGPVGGQLSDHTLTLNLPAQQFGWGFYTLNIRALTKNSSGVVYYSDWWPQLTAH